MAFGLEGSLLVRLERGDRATVLREERVVVAQAESLMLDFELHLALDEVVAEARQLRVADWIKANLVEEPQQPRFVLGEICRLPVAVPHLTGAADELIAARPFHAINAEVGAPDADGVLRGPCARGIVFSGDEPVARIDGSGHGRAEIYVAEAEHEVARVEGNLLHLPDR